MEKTMKWTQLILTVVMGLLISSSAWAGTRTITVIGTVDDPQATVTVNGTPATVTEGNFSADVILTEGENTIKATTTDLADNSAEVSVKVTLDTVPPVITISSPSEGQLFGAKK